MTLLLPPANELFAAHEKLDFFTRKSKREYHVELASYHLRELFEARFAPMREFHTELVFFHLMALCALCENTTDFRLRLVNVFEALEK